MQWCLQDYGGARSACVLCISRCRAESCTQCPSAREQCVHLSKSITSYHYKGKEGLSLHIISLFDSRFWHKSISTLTYLESLISDFETNHIFRTFHLETHFFRIVHLETHWEKLKRAVSQIRELVIVRRADHPRYRPVSLSCLSWCYWDPYCS